MQAQTSATVSVADHLAVGWQRLGDNSIQVIPGENLSPVQSSVRIYAADPNVAEGSGRTAVFTIVRDGSLVAPLTVSYTTRGEATNGADYLTLPGSITIPAGSASVSLEVAPTTDTSVEGDESVVIELLSSADYTVGLQSERTVNGRIQDDRDAQAGGESLWDGIALADFTRFGGTFTRETDPVYGDVIQAAITRKPGSVFNAQLKQNIDSPVVAGDILFVEFRMKSIGAPGKVSAIFERSGSPFTKSLSQGIPVSTDWQRIQIPFVSKETYAIGEASFGFHLGHQVQTLQFTDFTLVNYGPPRTLAPETNLRLNNLNGGTWGRAQSVSVSGQPFDSAYEVETTNVPAQNWHFQAVERNEVRVSNGDLMRVEFYARATAGTNPRAALTMQRTDTFGSLFNRQINLNSGWQFFTFDISSTDDFSANGLQFVFNLGHDLQTVQIGGLTWQNLDNPVDIEELPQQFPATTYAGRDGGDVWRNSADDRIAAERMSDVTVNVTDTNGNPLAGAVVSLRQNRHAFKFGSAISASRNKLDENGNDAALKY
ncbi:MAG: Calx-beta domain-containing protein [Planctomycetaceae bacterium]